MKSLWNDAEAAQFSGPLGPRVYSSRLLGRDKSLVLHGGGNTSVKLLERNAFGEEHEVLYVKGSGWDLETIEPAGFSPVALGYVRRLAQLDAAGRRQPRLQFDRRDATALLARIGDADQLCLAGLCVG